MEGVDLVRFLPELVGSSSRLVVLIGETYSFRFELQSSQNTTGQVRGSKKLINFKYQ